MVAENIHSGRHPRQDAKTMKHALGKLINDLREATRYTGEPKARALFETAAEVIGGLQKAFDHYARQSESAMTERTSELQTQQRSPKEENL